MYISTMSSAIIELVEIDHHACNLEQTIILFSLLFFYVMAFYLKYKGHFQQYLVVFAGFIPTHCTACFVLKI